MKTDNRKNTNKIELVETHNIALSIQRLRDAGQFDQERWKRALTHALGMCHVGDSTQTKVREALELP